MHFRCHTRHAFTISALLSDVSESVGDMLWQAMRGLEDSNILLEQLSKHFEQQGQEEVAKLFFSKAGLVARKARIIHDAIFDQQILSADIRLEKEKNPKKGCPNPSQAPDL